MKAKSVGFTLVELLVVIAIIGVMVAMTIPAVQASRETGRRNLCRHNMAQLMLALHSYENAFESFPAGVTSADGPIRSEPVGLHQGWIVQLLPYLDERAAFRLIDFGASVYDPANAEVRQYWPSFVVCPSEFNEIKGASNYAGCHHDVESPIDADNRGVLFLNSHVRQGDVADGLSHTFFVGEKRADTGDLGWMSGTRATLRNTGLPPNDPSSDDRLAGSVGGSAPNSAVPTAALTYVGGFASAHSGGLHMGFGDASIRFLSDQIDPKVWQQLANRSDGGLVNLHFPE
jgi:prepilin-type N-terminal cleavage/methylation domain-containing protein